MKRSFLMTLVAAMAAVGASADAAAQNVLLEMKSVVPDSLMFDESLPLPTSLPGDLSPLMYPGHSFGGSVEVKITDKFGLQAVAQRSYNAFTRRWDNSYYVLPVFY